MSDQLVTRLRDANTQLRDQLAADEKLIKTLNREVSEYRQEVMLLADENERLHDQLDAAQDRNEVLQEKYNTLADIYKQCADERSRAESKVRDILTVLEKDR